MSEPFQPCCPSCGHRFTLLDLAHMAEGDGWVRRVAVETAEGQVALADFRALGPGMRIADPAEVRLQRQGEAGLPRLTAEVSLDPVSS